MSHTNRKTAEPTFVQRWDISIDQAVALAKHARRIRDIEIKDLLEIGRELQAAHEILANHHRGCWCQWCETELGMSRQTADNKRRAYLVFGTSCKTVLQLIDHKALYLLARNETPIAARRTALARAEAGERITWKLALEIVSGVPEDDDPGDGTFNRKRLLRQLEAVVPGLAEKVIIEQCNCFIFSDGFIQTFNDEIACATKSDLNIVGAVPAAPLLKLVHLFEKDRIKVWDEDGVLKLAEKGRRASIRFEREIMLQFDTVTPPASWRPVPPDLEDAISAVYGCASLDNRDEFRRTGVHFHPDYMETCDNLQLCRYIVKTGIDAEYLVRAASLWHVMGRGMTEMAESEGWLHFRGPSGLVMSCRRWIEDYVDLSQYIDRRGAQLTLPSGLEKAATTAYFFSQEVFEPALVELRPNKLRVSGHGKTGSYSEVMQIRYDGPPAAFLMQPRILAELAKRGPICQLAGNVLTITDEKFSYAAINFEPSRRADDRGDSAPDVATAPTKCGERPQMPKSQGTRETADLATTCA